MVINMECLIGMRMMLADNSIDAVVTDPPYGLSKQPDMNEVLRHWLNGDDYVHTGGGFMGKTWDSFVPGPSVWKEVFRVLKPGGHLLAFFGTRTYDLGTLAIRLAGFEIRDQIDWVYGSGFPKSLNVSKATDDEQWQGWGTALKPAHEPICVARKPLAGTVAENVLQFGTGGMNIDDCRVGDEVRFNPPALLPAGGNSLNMSAVGMPENVDGNTVSGRWPANFIHDGSDEVINLLPGGSERYFYCAKASKSDRDEGVMLAMVTGAEMTGREPDTDGLNSPRAGAGRTSGARNNHPTVKPTALMQWLVRLVTPPGGKVLDPFTGSGSTGKACAIEGFDFIGFEMDPHYCEIAKQRIAYVHNR
jgi:site-specific DNA-methyltransferase (adenine-specific)